MINAKAAATLGIGFGSNQIAKIGLGVRSVSGQHPGGLGYFGPQHGMHNGRSRKRRDADLLFLTRWP